MDVQIKTMTMADLDGADAVVAAAYRAPSGRHDELAFYLYLQPDGWFYGTADGQPAVVGGAIDFGPFANVGMIGVHPSLQRRGLARALLERLLAWLDARNTPLALLDASDMGAPLYPQYGFVDCGFTLQFRHTADEALAASASLPSSVSLLTMCDLPLLAAYDAPLFGADRRRVLEYYATRNTGRVFLSRGDAGQISGYLVARPEHLGPWAADSAQDAEQLLRAALSLPYRRSPLINVPAENEAALLLLERYGFSRQRALRHMYRGNGPLPGRRDLIYAQANFTLG